MCCCAFPELQGGPAIVATAHAAKASGHSGTSWHSGAGGTLSANVLIRFEHTCKYLCRCVCNVHYPCHMSSLSDQNSLLVGSNDRALSLADRDTKEGSGFSFPTPALAIGSTMREGSLALPPPNPRPLFSRPRRAAAVPAVELGWGVPGAHVAASGWRGSGHCCGLLSVSGRW